MGAPPTDDIPVTITVVVYAASVKKAKGTSLIGEHVAGKDIVLETKRIYGDVVFVNLRELGTYSRGRNQILPDQHPAHDQSDDDEDDRKFDKREAFCRIMRIVPLQHLLVPVAHY